MIRILVLISVLFFSTLTFSQASKINDYTLTIKKSKIVKENKQTFWVIPTTLTNNSRDTLRYFSHTCWWSDFYHVTSKNKNLQIQGPAECRKSALTILTLAPGKTSTVELKLLVSKTTEVSKTRFKIGFDLIKASKEQKLYAIDEKELKKKNKIIIWSNVISM